MNSGFSAIDIETSSGVGVVPCLPFAANAWRGMRSRGGWRPSAPRTLCCAAAAGALSAIYGSPAEAVAPSYTSLPFASQVYLPSWGSSPQLAPGNLFWQSGSWFTNSTDTAEARQSANQLTAKGIAPVSGSQNWSDTYARSFPAGTFPTAPAYINSATYSTIPEFVAWRNWQQAHQTLFIVDNNGNQLGSDYASWGTSWGHISPLMPLPQADWPPGMTNATYGDWYAYRWGQTAKLSGAWGIQLSDYSDSQPGGLSNQEGFNPQIIAAFSQWAGVTIPSGAISAQSLYITTNYFALWDDYLDMGYAKFWAQLSNQITAQTGHQALVIDQCGSWPSATREWGRDERIDLQFINSANFMCIWDNQTIQVGRGGQDMIYSLDGAVVASAREPDAVNGANLEANDSAFWQAVAYYQPNFSAATQQEWGLKQLKRGWLENSWAHVATSAGQVRRALAFMSRDYWDMGTIDPTLQNLIQTIVPTRPFGFALYYSTAAERAQEQTSIAAGGLSRTYLQPTEMMNFKNEGGVVNYYVSDAALANLQPSAYPTAWIALDRAPPAAEMQRLQAIAPVLTKLSTTLSFPNPALAFSTGLTGFGFYDQKNRLIVSASNPGSSTLNGTMTLNGLPAGTYTATDLFTGTQFAISIAAGKASVPISVSRWDTRVFAIAPAPS